MSVQEQASLNDLGIARDIDIFDRLADWKGLEVVDCGCGAGGLAGALAKRGATVTGIEPDPIQAEKNRAADPKPGVTLVEAPAQSIPRDTDSVDAVVFSKSLHHVPFEQMDAALREAARVLKPDGFLYVLEPDIRGQFSQLVKPFHDETLVREKALEALDRTANQVFGEMEEYWYTNVVAFPDFDTLVNRMSGSSFNDIQASQIDTPDVRTAFEAGKAKEGYEFTNLMRVRLYRGPRPA
ncbi:MAG: class I SAM-dependent methyltransferase [Alphaproteobacteria bacterium]|jgi:ubiquinone/menaquinone biosynthesis C-methylase UbiE